MRGSLWTSATRTGNRATGDQASLRPAPPGTPPCISPLLQTQSVLASRPLPRPHPHASNPPLAAECARESRRPSPIRHAHARIAPTAPRAKHSRASYSLPPGHLTPRRASFWLPARLLACFSLTLPRSPLPAPTRSPPPDASTRRFLPAGVSVPPPSVRKTWRGGCSRTFPSWPSETPDVPAGTAQGTARPARSTALRVISVQCAAARRSRAGARATPLSRSVDPMFPEAVVPAPPPGLLRC